MKINSLGFNDTLAGRVLTFRELQFWWGGGGLQKKEYS